MAQHRPNSPVSTEMQLRTRRERRFSETESSLPSVSQHSSFDVRQLKPDTAKAAAKSKLSDLFSYLGPYNPRPQPITSKDVVWLLDNVAFRGAGGRWEAEFVAAAFQQHSGDTVVDCVQDVAARIGLSNDDEAFATIEERLIPFLMTILPGRQIDASFDERTELSLGPGGRNGISSDKKRLPHADDGEVLHSVALVPEGVTGTLRMKTVFAEPDGWAVISDVDDTIKVTQTSDPVGILTSTFVSVPKPIDGMPELYAYIQTLVTTAAPFFYLSASPYNLYPFLSGFRDQFYPHGQLILRDASWMSIPGLLSNLTLGTQDYKVDRMKKVHGWLPKRKMICIGDSTQSDPEAYGEIYRAFPDWVRIILIRKVTDIASIGIQAKNEPQRFEKAFDGVPRSVWHVFEDPSECYEIVHNAISGRHH